MAFDCSDERCAAETRETEKGEGGKGEEGVFFWGVGGGGGVGRLFFSSSGHAGVRLTSTCLTLRFIPYQMTQSQDGINSACSEGAPLSRINH